MAQIMCEITLDVSVKDPGLSMMAKQGDSKSRLLCVHLTDEGKPLVIEEGSCVLLNVARGEEAFAFEGRVVGGNALFVLPAFALAEAGCVRCDVSVLGTDAEKLTSVAFTLEVEAAVCPDGALGDEAGEDLAATLLAEETLQPLLPHSDNAGYLLRPALNRKYTVDLSGSGYLAGGVWKSITLELPTPEHPTRDNWVLLYCHAPVDAVAGAVTLAFGDCLFADGNEPIVTTADFNVVCTYSPIAAKWQIGVISYGESGALL